MSLFTVEQLELVRRLKLTGMSVDKILEVSLFYVIGNIWLKTMGLSTKRRMLLACLPRRDMRTN